LNFTCDVADEEILEVARLAPELGVKVETAGLEAALPEHHLHGQGGLLDVHVELVGIPAQQSVAGVGINAAQESVRRGCKTALNV
jgi:hypothetical protein